MPLVSTGHKSKIIINEGNEKDEFEVEYELTPEGKIQFTFQVPISPNARTLPEDYILSLLKTAVQDINWNIGWRKEKEKNNG